MSDNSRLAWIERKMRQAQERLETATDENRRIGAMMDLAHLQEMRAWYDRKPETEEA